jgi:hypothetical protein
VVWRRLKQNFTCCTNMSANKFMLFFLPVKLPSNLSLQHLIGECWKTSSPTSFGSPKINFHKRTNEISMLPSVIGIDQVTAELQMQINDVRNDVTLKDPVQQGHTHTFGDDSGHFLATGPQRVLQRGRNSASSFSIRYLLLFLTSSTSCLRILSRLPDTFILPSIFPSITCLRSQFLHKLWPIQLAFLLLIVCRTFLCSLTLCNTTSFLRRSAQLISQSLSSTTFQNCVAVSDLLWELSWKCHWHIIFTNKILTLFAGSFVYENVFYLL